MNRALAFLAACGATATIFFASSPAAAQDRATAKTEYRDTTYGHSVGRHQTLTSLGRRF